MGHSSVYMGEQYETPHGEADYRALEEAERRGQGGEGGGGAAADSTDLNPSTTTVGKWARKYRSKYEIIAAIIESASRQAKNKMHLMFDAYLSYTQINREYIPLLLGSDLLLEH